MNARHHHSAAGQTDFDAERFGMDRLSIGANRPGPEQAWRATPATPAPHAVTRVFDLPQGLHALSIGQLEPASAGGGTVSLPCIQLVSMPSAELDPVDIFTAWNDQGAWLGVEGGVVVVRAPPGGGQVLATLYGGASIDATMLDAFAVQPLEPSGAHAGPEIGRADLPMRPLLSQASPRGGEFEAPPAPLPQAAWVEDDEWPAPAEDGGVELEILLHMEQSGDALYPGGAWCGTIGQKLQVEGFGLRCTDPSVELTFEYKAFGPAGRETRWVTDGKLCGTRGRGIPLTGFAIRLTAAFADDYDVTYQGAFFESGVTLPVRNGQPCLPPLTDDCLEAILVRVGKRTA